ncbi:CCA-adding enzyme [Candidatus Izimaplasma bacterium HR1]|uniref:CCA tRNA nucleotidyltransferase n=1 Tax=Candidatus Izimoplasma sp. HR1 TaxID=1541959 RepID=UPI0004F69187|nr:CCA-adding enzyme [Candidatus Izimaplasma bacterium HR1]
MNRYFENAKGILKRLKSKGYDAYIVGGYVRDKVIGLKSDDIDITTSATPEEVDEVFENVKNTGRKFGGVTVIIDDHKYEVTTFRLEGEYAKHRYPKDVSFSKEVFDDIKRRDFTMNALYMDENENINDKFNGLKDIEDKIIRTINDPKERLNEDALRILRAFRFVSKLGFDIELETLAAITSLKHLVKTVTIERIMVELDKIFNGDYQKKAIKYLVKTGISEELYGIDKGLEYISNIKEFVYPLEVFIISDILGDLEDTWRFSNNNYRLIKQVVNLHEVTKENEFNKYILFSNKLDPCLLTNRINVLLGYKDQKQFIMDMYKDMPVMDVCDLKFKGQDILALTTMNNRRLISLVIDDLLYNVIMGIMPNEYEVLKQFSLRRVAELQKEMGDLNE